MFPHKKAHGVTENQISHVCVLAKFKRPLLDVRAVDVASDHYFIMGKFRFKLKNYNEGPKKTSY